MRRTLEKLAQERKEKEEAFAQKLEEIKTKIQGNLLRNLALTKDIFSSLTRLVELQAALADAKDKEWDALGSNHVAMIFKSLEWRVDKLATAYEDVNILMKKFTLLREKLDTLLNLLEERRMPSADQTRELLEPLEDWRYASFENRFRGYPEEVKKQQQVYVDHFPKGGKILDLGCGRGEFLELLQENGFQAFGVDLNGQMVDICLDKGLACQKGDIQEKLAEWEDGSLDGIFSSQVIEHLPLPYLRTLVETAHRKLSPGGRIILETVNPTSVFALVQIYFLDLTHQKPIHPQALKFLLEDAGFEEVEIKYSFPLEKERLQNLPGADEQASLINRNIDSLNELLYAPPNYAAIGLRR